MRIAVVSDIHGNRTAFEAVIADLGRSSPDLVLHGGDLADGGSSPAQIIDQIRDLGWPGVAGNADEMLWNPDSLETFAKESRAPETLFIAVRRIATATREALGKERIAWLGALPQIYNNGPLALVHATRESCWRAPNSEATDAELQSAYGSLQQSIVIYAHIHRPYIRKIPNMTVANTGSVGLPTTRIDARLIFC